MAVDRTKDLTTPHQIKPTSTSRHSAWRPNRGRPSTHQRGDSVQTTGTGSHDPDGIHQWDECASLLRRLQRDQSWCNSSCPHDGARVSAKGEGKRVVPWLRADAYATRRIHRQNACGGK